MQLSYNAKDVETSVLSFWEKNKIYEKAKQKVANGKSYYFLQGPPYTSGRIHIGHAWNMSLKDMALRFKRMTGWNVWDRAGYDVHGLPTENKVQAKFKLETKEDILKFGMEPFIKECIAFSKEHALLMDQDFWRLGVWMDYENAYYPLNNSFIEGEWWLIKRAFEEKRLYKGKKVMHWCASCETALAKHELEYETITDESIFLKFALKNKPNEFLVVWTTTPWTIPFNLGVMVNPNLDYVRAKIDGANEVWIVAKALVNVFLGSIGKKFSIVEECKGSHLEGLEYVHPLSSEISAFASLKIDNPRVHSVVLSEEYVDTTAGSGLVHMAPGCGPEDFEVGQKVGIPAFNALNEQGSFENMGVFSGWHAKANDKKFVAALDQAGCLIEKVPVTHEYAHCWRCHKPVVFRTTEQWFLRVEDLKEKILKANENVYWVPSWAKDAFASWVKNLRDNSITRQRFWGTPVPIWTCDSCGRVDVIGSQDELQKFAATKVPSDLHKPWIDDVKLKCSCGKLMSRDPDVLDVWIDAGTTSWNCLDFPTRNDLMNGMYPADLVLEATEQIRLWFSMLMIGSFVALDKPAFKNVYVYGMILDYSGNKMSKSLGNVISPYEVIDKVGVDVMRYYMIGTPAGENVNFTWDECTNKQRNLGVLWNLHKYVIEICVEHKVNPSLLDAVVMQSLFGAEERFILSRLHSTIAKVTKLMEEYHFDNVPNELEQFFLDVSRTYVKLVREKVATGDKEDREVVMYTLFSCVHELLSLAAPVMPFVSEQMYQNVKEAFLLEVESVHLQNWPLAQKKLQDEKLEMSMKTVQLVIESVLAGRDKSRINVRWPLKSVEVECDGDVALAVELLEDVIKTQTNIKEVHVHEQVPFVQFSVKANVAMLGKDFGNRAPLINDCLAKKDARSVVQSLQEGNLSVKLGKEMVVLQKEHVLVSRVVPAHYHEVEFKGGRVYLNLERSSVLEAEGFAREIMRRVQSARKDAGLEKAHRITLHIQVPATLDEMLKPWHDRIALKCGAEKILVNQVAPTFEHVATADIKGEKVVIGFEIL